MCLDKEVVSPICSWGFLGTYYWLVAYHSLFSGPVVRNVVPAQHPHFSPTWKVNHKQIRYFNLVSSPLFCELHATMLTNGIATVHVGWKSGDLLAYYSECSILTTWHEHFASLGLFGLGDARRSRMTAT